MDKTPIKELSPEERWLIEQAVTLSCGMAPGYVPGMEKDGGKKAASTLLQVFDAVLAELKQRFPPE